LATVLILPFYGKLKFKSVEFFLKVRGALALVCSDALTGPCGMIQIIGGKHQVFFYRRVHFYSVAIRHLDVYFMIFRMNIFLHSVNLFIIGGGNYTGKNLKIKDISDQSFASRRNRILCRL
jgi:hypothetical protein